MRPAIYSEEIHQAICDAVALGVPECHAADACGLSESTLRRWKAENSRLKSDIKKARSKALSIRVKRIQDAAKGGQIYEETTETIEDGSTTKTVITKKRTLPQWTADAWYLERQFCEQFGMNRIDVKMFEEFLEWKKRYGNGTRLSKKSQSQTIVTANQ